LLVLAESDSESQYTLADFHRAVRDTTDQFEWDRKAKRKWSMMTNLSDDQYPVI
jgi:hypothetical protein